MAICPQCGKENWFSAKSCSSCGADLGSTFKNLPLAESQDGDPALPALNSHMTKAIVATVLLGLPMLMGSVFYILGLAVGLAAIYYAWQAEKKAKSGITDSAVEDSRKANFLGGMGITIGVLFWFFLILQMFRVL